MFLVSLVHHRHPAFLHCQALILDRLLTFLMAFPVLVLNLPFFISLHSHLFVAQANHPEFDHSVFGSHWRW